MLKRNVKSAFACLLTASMLVSNIAPVYADENPGAEANVTQTTTAWINQGTEEAPDWHYHVYTSVDGGEATDAEYNVEYDYTTPATCTESGTETWTATEGDTVLDVKTIEVPATGHTPAEAVIENEETATCTEEGSYDSVVYCSVCDAELSREKITTDPATGHTPAEAVKENEVAATCTEDGSHDEVVYCSVCDAELSRETVTDKATGHDFTDYYTKQDATCTKAGYTYGTCTVCGEKVRQEIPAKGHTPAEAVKENEVAATCTEDGSHDEVVYCSVCDAELSRETVTDEALGHDYEIDDEGVLVEPTCTTEGKGTFKCTRCDDVKEDVIEKTAHTYGAAVEDTESRIEPTCTKEGYEFWVKTCAVCGNEERTTVTLDATGHTWGEAVEVEDSRVEPTCTEDGSYETAVYCTECGTEKEDSRETEKIPATGHTPAEAVTENEKAATCIATGSYDSVVYCSVCEEEISRNTIETPVDSDAHDYQVVSTVKEPTCTQNGIGYYECSLCGTKKADTSQTIPALGHDTKTVKENEVAATCTEDGSYDVVVYCTRENCDLDVEVTENGKEVDRTSYTIPATGHNYEGAEAQYVSKEPTCTETGLGYYICTVCGKKSDNVVIPAKGHTAGDPVVENPDSKSGKCTDAATYDEVVYCSVCDAEMTRESKSVEPKENHVYNAEDVTFIFDEVDYLSGVAVFKCANEAAPGQQCNDVHRIMFTVDPEAQEYVVDKEATCTEDGSAHYVASVTYEGVTATADTRSEKVLPATGHTVAIKLVESEDTEGKYDIVTYCTTCDEIISVEKDAVSDVDAVVENLVEPTCEEDGSYELVVTVGSVEKRIPKVIPATGHVEGTPIKENITETTCTEGGSYDSVVYCSVCGKELSRETIETEATGHVETDAVIENSKAATCTEDGSYDTVVYCSVCGEEISRETTTVDKLGHTEADAVIENIKEATATTNRSYDEVVYCKTCGAELSRNTVEVEKDETVITVADKTVTYTGEAVEAEAVVIGSIGVVTYEYSTEDGKAPVNAGTYTVTASVAGDKNYKAATSEAATITIDKAAASVTVAKTDVSYTTGKTNVLKKAHTFSIGAASTSNGKMSYTVSKYYGKAKSYLSIDAATGKVTVKSGAPVGTYKMKVAVYSAATANYKGKTKNVTITVTVK